MMTLHGLICCAKVVPMELSKRVFGAIDGHPAYLYTLKNTATGASVSFTNYGGIITSIKVPDHAGNVGEITLGFDNLAAYVDTHPYFGSTVGRVCNRIAKGKFTLDGREYTLACNNKANHLHGGPQGFHKQLWTVVSEQVTQADATVVLKYISKDGEEGYPGNLSVTLSYKFTADNRLHTDLTATTDAPTPVNLTNARLEHTYWNLAGPESNTTVFQHQVSLNADRYLPVTDELLPTGEVKPVSEAPWMDFVTKPHAIGERISQTEGSYDNCYILNDTTKAAARVTEPKTRRVLEVWTNQPGIQFYSGNFLAGLRGPNGAVFDKHTGFCLEPQGYVNAVNVPTFPSIIFRPGQTYQHNIVFKFSTQ